MAHERTHPCFPCTDVDEAVAFYEALDFVRTFRQLKPNPYAVVRRKDLHIHLFGMPGFDPAQSYACVIVESPDPDTLYHAFAAGFRKKYGKLPTAGIPRILRPRKKFGTVSGFSVVDVGGNWLRIYKTGDQEPEESEESTGLARIVDVASRLGDAHGDDKKALKTLKSGIERYPDASVIDRGRAYLYQADLAIRLKNIALAKASMAAFQALKIDKARKLSKEDKMRLDDEWKHVTALLKDAESSQVMNART